VKTSVNTRFRAIRPATSLVASMMILLSMSATGCVVAATGQVDNDEKSQTEQLDTTTASGDVPKVPNNDAVKTGGSGGGPDPSPWRVAEQNGGPNGPDPSPWDQTPSSTANTTRK
jgi:hypothetical protein